MIFLLESGLVAAIGGVLGALLGTGVALLVGAIAQFSGFTFIIIRIEPMLMLGAIAFAFVIGIASGILPAKQAAKMVPVEAMRS